MVILSHLLVPSLCKGGGLDVGSATPPLKNTTSIEYFEDLLNRPSPVKPPDIQPAEENLPIDCRKPIKEEIKMAI